MDDAGRERCVRLATPWLTALVVLMVTAVAAVYVARTSRTREAFAFEATARYAVDLVERRIDNYPSILEATSALFASTDRVESGAFERFVRHLELTSKHPALRGIGYAERDGAAYRVRHFEPVSRRPLPGFGKDLAAEPVLARAIAHAVASGESAASGPLRFLDAGVERTGVLIVVPVYEDDVPATEAGRMDAAAGVVFGRVAMEDLVTGLFGGDSFLDVALYEGLEPDPEHLVYAIARDHRPRHVLDRQIDVAGRPWTLVIRSTPAYERGSAMAVPLVVVGGTLLALLLFGLTRSLARAHAGLERTASDLRLSEAALRYSEQRARALIDQSPLAVQVFDPTGHTVAVNPAWEALFGIPAEEIASSSILHDPQLRESGVLPLVEQAFAGHSRPVPPIRYAPAHGRYAGDVRWIQAHVYPVLADDRVREVVAMYDDVTSRRQVEEALRDAQRLESLGVMAGGIAHDFNNLLTGVLGYATLGLSEIGPDDPVRPMLEQIVTSSERAADLTRQLLAYAGKGRYVVARLDLGEVVREVRQLLVAVSPSAAVDVDVEGTLAIDADHGQMHQLLLNLVLNAVESYGDRPGRVLIRAWRLWLDEARITRDFPSFELEPGEYVAVEVVDQGEGMDPRTLARIFDPFFTTRFMGRGLGLAAALGIVRGHHGGILARSRPGAGTHLLVVLPSPVGEGTRPAPVPTVALYGHGRVLVVDDEPVVRQTARLVLEGYGYDVVEAENGREALGSIAEDPDIDVVLLDISMPVLDGAEALGRIRQLRPDLPIVATSGYGEEEALRRFAGAAADAFLQKPYRGSALAAKIARVLARSGGPAVTTEPTQPSG